MISGVPAEGATVTRGTVTLGVITTLGSEARERGSAVMVGITMTPAMRITRTMRMGKMDLIVSSGLLLGFI